MSIRRLMAMALLMTAPGAGVAFAQTPTAEHLFRTYGHILPGPTCATEEFVVEFPAGDSEVTEAIRARARADLVHPRSCNVEAVYLAAYDPAARDAVRDLLVAEGLRAEAIRTIQLTVPVAPFPYAVEHVRVTFIYH